MRKPDYDTLANIYDWLAKLVFGDNLIEAQKFLLSRIKPGSAILIAGGGTGYILEEITMLQPAGLQITYVESSKKMMALSVKRRCGNNHVVFINEPIENVPDLTTFDVVITPFFFDNFSDATSSAVFEKLNGVLKAKGLWLFADFTENAQQRFWQKPLLQLMYLFFRMTCHIEASRLPDTDSLFAGYNYQIIADKTFFKKFIRSVVYKKP